MHERMEAIMERASDETLKTSLTHDTTLRTAAYILAVDRVAEAHRLRGVRA